MAAVDVYTLLSLPSSKAFTAFRSSDFDVVEDSRSESPPRKTPRLAADSDSASASRARSAAVDTARADGKPTTLVIQLSGQPIKVQPERVYDRDFALVRQTIRVLLTKGTTDPLPGTYARIYSACQAVVCDAQRGEGLYDNLKLELERCLGNILNDLVRDERTGVAWLEPFVQACEWFWKRVTLMKSLFACLDRIYAAGQKLQDVTSLAHEGLYKRIFQEEAIVQRIRDGIKDWLAYERRHDTEHELRPLIPALVAELQRHGLYHDLFEHHYVELTHAYYVSLSLELRNKLSPVPFVKQVSAHEAKEHSRVEAVALKSTAERVSHETIVAMLAAHVDWLAQGAVPAIMYPELRIEDLAQLYSLHKRVDGLKVLLQVFKSYVRDRVKDIVQNKDNIKEKDEEMVSRLLVLKADCDKVVTKAFVDLTATVRPTPSRPSTSTTVDMPAYEKVPNREFAYAVRDAFTEGFKARRTKPAEMIAKHIDKEMRRGQKSAKDQDFLGGLETVLELYRFTDDKDVFRTFYHRALAKRLLLEKSASDDHEKRVLTKLKERYDPEFSMGEDMFKDLELSKELTAEYHEKFGGDEALSVMVLRRSAWPFTARKQDIVLPVWMTDQLTKYADFYKVKHKKPRVLSWDHALGTATLRANFKAGKKELTVSLYQATVLLLFNDAEKWSFADIKAQMGGGMEDAELRRTLQSLACGSSNKRVLRKQPHGKEVDDTDVFIFNADFTNPAFRVHINAIQVKETPEEAKHMEKAILQDRKYAVDAAIVRIMKGKKKMHYEQLKTATIEAVTKHFLPEVSLIKKSIDGLVESEYLRRDEDDMNVLHYVA